MRPEPGRRAAIEAFALSRQLPPDGFMIVEKPIPVPTTACPNPSYGPWIYEHAPSAPHISCFRPIPGGVEISPRRGHGHRSRRPVHEGSGQLVAGRSRHRWPRHYSCWTRSTQFICEFALCLPAQPQRRRPDLRTRNGRPAVLVLLHLVHMPDE
jgi:hypothetical protein